MMRRFLSATPALVVGLLVGGSVIACGGGNKKANEPVPDETDDEALTEDEGSDEELIPEVKFEEIRHTFERKAKTVAPCFPEALDAGEVDSDEKVKLSVGLTIQPDGRPTNLEILGASKRSKTLEACVLNNVGRWQFTDLPHEIKYSYSFILQNF